MKFQEFFKEILGKFQGCFKKVKGVQVRLKDISISLMGVSRVFERSSTGGLCKFQWYFKEVSKKFHECFKKVSRVFQESFNCVSREFLVGFKGI